MRGQNVKHLLAFSLVFFLSHFTWADAWKPFALFNSTENLHSEIQQLKKELSTLPNAVPTKRPWTLGYQTEGYLAPEKTVTVEIEFNEAQPIDLIVLVPAIIFENDAKYYPLGFPERFVIECIHKNGDLEILADYRQRDYQIQGIEPQLFECREKTAIKKLRLTVTQLSANEIWAPEKYRFALSEIMAFAGGKNVALNQKIEVYGSQQGDWGWYISKLTDGFFTFSPVDRAPAKTDTNFKVHADRVQITFDFGKKKKIDAFRIWPISQEFHRRQLYTSGQGFPADISIFSLEDLSTPTPIKKLIFNSWTKELNTPGSNPYHRSITPTATRYVRFNLSKPVVRDLSIGKRIMFSELEILSDGKCISSNIVPWVKVTASEENILTHPATGSSSTTLTDGFVEEGKIIALKSWVKQINRRFAGERQLSSLQKQVHFLEQKEKNTYQTLALLLLTTAIILSLLIWGLRLYSKQKLSNVREQIACDIHDEIGANLNSIALAQELLKKEIKNPTLFQTDLISDSLHVARSTAKDATQITRFLEGRAFHQPLEEQIIATGRKLLRGMETSYDFTANRSLERLSTADKWDVLFFIKEVFNNISKHADASKVTVTCSKIRSTLQLIISDDGCGIPEKNTALVHLEKRAKRLRAQLDVDTSPGVGTTIILQLK